MIHTKCKHNVGVEIKAFSLIATNFSYNEGRFTAKVLDIYKKEPNSTPIESNIKFICNHCGIILDSDVAYNCDYCSKTTKLDKIFFSKKVPGWLCQNCLSEREIADSTTVLSMLYDNGFITP